MSRTSCYRYVMELPTSTLDEMLRAAFSESDTADIPITSHEENVPIGSYTATVDAGPDDVENNPPTLDLGPVDLSLTMHLRMRLEVKVNEVAGLDPLVYIVTFDFPGVFEKDVALSRLVIRFPAVTAADLHLVISGGDVPLTPELIEPKVHALFQAHPELATDLQTGVAWPPGPDATVAVKTDTYDDAPGSMPFHGAITVAVPDPTHIEIAFPGHFKIYSLSKVYVNTDTTTKVTVEVVTDRAAGLLRVKLQDVQNADVEATFATSSLYDIAVIPTFEGNFAAKMRALGEQTQAIPNEAELQSMISARLLQQAPDLVIPVFIPAAPDAGEVDLRDFEPATVNQQVLALQIAPRNDGTPCNPPDVFARTTGFSVAIADVEINPMIEEILATKRGEQNFGGYDMDVQELTAALHDSDTHDGSRGHIWIEGKTEVHVDCWFDPEIEFEGPIYLKPQTGPDGHVLFSVDAGTFTADDPCCADVEPEDIAEILEGQKSAPIALPSHFSGVGDMQLNLTEAEIFADSVVVHGDLTITTLHALHRQALRRTLFWFDDTSP